MFELEIMFWSSVFGIGYAYLGYPLSLVILSVFKNIEQRRGASALPAVTVIITAYNEEKRIEEKLENTLALEYPSEKRQIIVASDGSTDATNEVTMSYRQRGVELLALTKRRGKEAAQKAAILRATGKILVFTDAATFLRPDGLKQIVLSFSDPSVGCVSSEDRLLTPNGLPAGEGLYVRYEMWLRRLESKIGSLVGLSGSFFAARREVCQEFSDQLQSDFGTVLNSVKMGLRGVLEKEAIGYYHNVVDDQREFDRKVRTVVRGLTVFFRNLEFLNPVRYGLFAYQFICHKLLRWLVPFFLGFGLLSSFTLAFWSDFYLALLMAQLAIYGLALLGFGDSNSSRVWFRIPAYFVRVNISIFVAWWRYLQGQRIVMWTPSRR